jgi:hypothetical protein
MCESRAPGRRSALGVSRGASTNQVKTELLAGSARRLTRGLSEDCKIFVIMGNIFSVASRRTNRARISRDPSGAAYHRYSNRDHTHNRRPKAEKVMSARLLRL